MVDVNGLDTNQELPIVGYIADALSSIEVVVL